MTEQSLSPAADDALTFKHSAEDFLAGESPLSRLRTERASATGFSREVWQAMAGAGWPAILVPEACDGLGLGLRHACAIAEALGGNPAPEPYTAVGVQAASALAACPPSGLRDRLLARLAAGELLAGLAWQESVAEIEPTQPRTRAEAGPSGARLDGVKHWVIPGEGADGWLVSVQDEAGPALYWVPAGTPGVGMLADRRFDGSRMGTLRLEGVELPADHRLAHGAEAGHALAAANDAARMAQAAELLGVARKAFDITLDYLKTRVQFDKPIGANQALQHRMVDAWLQVELASACLEESLALLEREPGRLAEAASRAKARCEHAALHVTRLAVQFHGAVGYTDECDIGLFLKRAIALSSWLGNAAAHRVRAHRLRPAETEQEAAPKAATAAGRDADWNAMSDAEFRATVRAFLRANYPEDLRFPPRRLHWHELKDWYLTLSRQGWLAPAWPRRFGGMELAPEKLLAFIEETEAYGVARTPDQGIINLGPVLIRFGTPEQQQTYLPRILSGEHIWCQGYSEPNAGSDLASLRTEAVPDGDDFIVNGQKIWTTLAQDATHIFLLVRTDKTVKKQAGISFLLVDLATPGITVRPIPNICGDEEFCEVFFDDVRVPQANLVGGLNQGWTIAKALLGFERIFVGSPQQSRYALNQLALLGRAMGRTDDPVFVSRFAELELDVLDLAALYGRFSEMVKRGEQLPPSVSLLKIWATETYTRISTQLAADAAEHGGALGPADFDGERVNPLAPFTNAIITTIYGGTNEVQRNILAKQVLGLPV